MSQVSDLLPAAALLLAFVGCSKPSPAPANAGSTAPVQAPPVSAPASETDGDGRLWFVDGTADSGLRFEHQMGATAERQLPETMGGSAAIADVDNDGDLDLYCVQSGILPIDMAALEAAARDPARRGSLNAGAPPNQLFLNDGAGTFSDHTAESGAAADRGYGQGVAAGDADGDGFIDFYVTNFGPDVFVTGGPGARFTDRTLESGLFDARWTAGASFFDADGDGDLDLYVTAYVAIDPQEPVWCGRREEGYRSYCSPDQYEGLEDRFWKNDGQGRFHLANAESGLTSTSGKGLDVCPVDIDLDGDLDLYVANDSVENRLWANAGDGTFTDQTLISQTGVNANGMSEAGMGIGCGDLDDDGDLDLFVTNLDQESNTFYRNDGKWFSDATARAGLDAPSRPWVGFGTVAEDFDLDGDLDLVVANGHIIHNIDLYYPERSWAQPLSVYENQGGARFKNAPEHLGALAQQRFVGRGLYAGDLDGDGDQDLLLMQCGGPAKLLFNQTPHSRPSIEVRDLPPGALIRAVSKDGQTRLRLAGGVSYYGTSANRAVFALPGELDLAATRVLIPGRAPGPLKALTGEMPTPGRRAVLRVRSDG